MVNDFFEVVVQVFDNDGVFNWSVSQDFGDDFEPEVLEYGYENTREAAFSAAGIAVKQLWEK